MGSLVVPAASTRCEASFEDDESVVRKEWACPSPWKLMPGNLLNAESCLKSRRANSLPKKILGRPFYNLDPRASMEAARRRAALAGVPEEHLTNLSLISACHQPVLLNIAEFLASSVQNIVRLCHTTSFSIATEMRFAENALFKKLYAQRWPAFHESACYDGAGDWRALYAEMLSGNTCRILEVYHREKKKGFDMSAMPAKVRYNAAEHIYKVDYMSASTIPPEYIPASEDFRFRFLPANARGQLLHPQREQPTGLVSNAESLDAVYPFKVLQGLEGLKKGQGVEVQWKMQSGSPFGWWYGDLEEIHINAGGSTATASVTFRHFPKRSRWYRMKLTFGDSQIRPCCFGGFTGGLRPTTQAEQKVWLTYLPWCG